MFERSFYVEARAGLACLGIVGNGPLNAHCNALPALPAIGESIVANLANAVYWKPRPAQLWDAARVAGSLARLREASRNRLPPEGFGFLLDTELERPAAVEAFALWLREPKGPPHDAAGLIGLGPGLTPAGDDLVGGALCALHAVGRVAAASRLAGWALPLAKRGTNRISQAHLACAAQGECGEAVNDAIVALLSGGSVDLGRISAIGHTSGWDTLAGAVLVLKSVK